MNLKQAIGAAAIGAVLAAAAPAQAQLAEGVAAIVNDHVITTYDVRQRANMLLTSAGIESNAEMQSRARAQAIRDLIDERLQLQEAARFDIAVTAGQIDSQFADIARANQMSAADFASNLSQAGVQPSTLRQQIEADIAWQRLISGLYGQRLRVSEVEVQDTLARIVANATRPQYLISEIFLPATTEAEFQEVQAGASRLIEEMQRGAPFPLVAMQFSQSASAAQRGDIGWIAASDLAPELQPIAERLQPGQVSLPIRTPTGVYIIAVRDRREGAPAGSASVVSLRQVSAPAARANALGRLQERVEGCGNLEREAGSVQGASVVDLGQTTESELSPAVRQRIEGVEAGQATAIETTGETANLLVVCGREIGGEGVPDRRQIEARLRSDELALIADRYLRSLRREATIIMRQ